MSGAHAHASNIVQPAYPIPNSLIVLFSVSVRIGVLVFEADEEDLLMCAHGGGGHLVFGVLFVCLNGMGGPRGFVELPYGARHLSDGVEMLV